MFNAKNESILTNTGAGRIRNNCNEFTKYIIFYIKHLFNFRLIYIMKHFYIFI